MPPAAPPIRTFSLRAMLGQPALLDAVPWFWSDQYDQKLIIIGLSMGHDELVAAGAPMDRLRAADLAIPLKDVILTPND